MGSYVKVLFSSGPQHCAVGELPSVGLCVKFPAPKTQNKEAVGELPPVGLYVKLH